MPVSSKFTWILCSLAFGAIANAGEAPQYADRIQCDAAIKLANFAMSASFPESSVVASIPNYLVAPGQDKLGHMGFYIVSGTIPYFYAFNPQPDPKTVFHHNYQFTDKASGQSWVVSYNGAHSSYPADVKLLQAVSDTDAKANQKLAISGDPIELGTDSVPESAGDPANRAISDAIKLDIQTATSGLRWSGDVGKQKIKDAIGDKSACANVIKDSSDKSLTQLFSDLRSFVNRTKTAPISRPPGGGGASTDRG